MQSEDREIVKDSECGALHDNCPNTWKGSCDREAGHSGSHSCSACRSAF